MKHTCHWPGCMNVVPAKLWGCPNHWFRLPVQLRNRIKATYVAGQEVTKTPSLEYVEVARRVRHWIKENSK